MQCFECEINQYKLRLEFAAEALAEKDALLSACWQQLEVAREQNRQLVELIKWLERANTNRTS